jgi:hypothetical protein
LIKNKKTIEVMSSFKKWYITKRANNTIVNYGEVGVGEIIDSGFGDEEIFTDVDSWLDRLNELGVDVSNQNINS